MSEKNMVVKNQLAGSGSPYLRQHAGNPVHWQQWSPEIFERAAAEGKPVFLSIGYSTCHWCHVMDRESFSDPEVASLMNETFVCVKVDREERPDVDQLYMTVCQLLTGSGGWPLTVILTPGKKPFFAGTYFPKGDDPGRPGMLQLIPKIQELWVNQRETVESSAREITEGIQAFLIPDQGSTPEQNSGERTFNALASSYDSEHGGFGTAPKFPVFTNLLFLLRYWARTGEKRALAMAKGSLDAMCSGGIYDHLGYGFHRYATDERWFVPHFEKMLYDQALAIMTYTEAFCATGEIRYGEVAGEIIFYVLRDLQSPDGGFYSAEDADSEGEEGKFYTWSTEELEAVLDSKEMSLVQEIYSVLPGGNFYTDTGQSSGRNILYLRADSETSGSSLKREQHDLALKGIREKLWTARELRKRPLRDEKIMTDWNGLMIAALAKAAAAFMEPAHAKMAQRALGFILEKRTASGNCLPHVSYDSGESIEAFLDDYAFLVWGILELHQFTQRPDLLRLALELTEEMIEMFNDRENGGFYLTSGASDSLLHRPKPSFDGPTPSGNSAAAMNFLRLGRLTGRGELEEEARRTFRSFARDISGNPGGFTHMVGALEMEQFGSTEVLIVGEPENEHTKGFLSSLSRVYLPTVTAVVIDPRNPDLGGLIPHAQDMKPSEGRPAAYICRNFSCLPPTTDPKRMIQILLAGQNA